MSTAIHCQASHARSIASGRELFFSWWLEAGTRVDRIAQSIASLMLEQRSVISDAVSHASSAAAAMSPACAQIHRRGGFTAATASAVQPHAAAGTDHGALDTDDKSPSFRPVAWCRLRRRSQPGLSRTETLPATGWASCRSRLAFDPGTGRRIAAHCNPRQAT